MPHSDPLASDLLQQHGTRRQASAEDPLLPVFGEHGEVYARAGAPEVNLGLYDAVWFPSRGVVEAGDEPARCRAVTGPRKRCRNRATVAATGLCTHHAHREAERAGATCRAAVGGPLARRSIRGGGLAGSFYVVVFADALEVIEYWKDADDVEAAGSYDLRGSQWVWVPEPAREEEDTGTLDVEVLGGALDGVRLTLHVDRDGEALAVREQTVLVGTA